MANPAHLDVLREGAEAWAAWRAGTPSTNPDLDGADLAGADLRSHALDRASLYGADLRGANLNCAHLNEAKLRHANLEGADLSHARLWRAYFHGAKAKGANLTSADLRQADLREVDFSDACLRSAFLEEADFSDANLFRADLRSANLEKADLHHVDLREANLRDAYLDGVNLVNADLNGADLTGASLARANLNGAKLVGANLKGADLSLALLVETDLTRAFLTGCRVFGVSAWRLTLDDADQRDLVVTQDGEPEITVDDLEVAQFIDLMVNNEKLQRVIDTITSKVVLILGRFSIPERKQVLDGLRDQLRERNYVPVVFDFEKPRSQTTVNTIVLLARMARFVIADVSDAKSILQELQAIVPASPKLPVQPLIAAGQDEPGMFDSFTAYPWFLPVLRYDSPPPVISELAGRAIAPAELAANKLRN